MARQRPFNPEALTPYAIPAIRPPLGIGALVWRYLVLVPLEETSPGQTSVTIAEMEDIENLRAILSDHFGGVTVLVPLMGFGLRDEGNPDSLELNRNLPFVIYARPIVPSDRYIETLQQELQEALGQGLILVERQEAFLMGRYAPPETEAIAVRGRAAVLTGKQGGQPPLPSSTIGPAPNPI